VNCFDECIWDDAFDIARLMISQVQIRLECLFSPRIHSIYEQAQKSLITVWGFTVTTVHQGRTSSTSIHRGIICAASLLLDQRPVDAGHTVLDVTIGRHRRLKNSNLPGVECLADVNTHK
jgi:hypothetical protein